MTEISHPPQFGLGRRVAVDLQDDLYPMRRLLPPKESLRPWRYWPAYRHHLDQGNFPHCVGFSLMHYLLDSPITTAVQITPQEIYHAAQLVDEWPGVDYDGTSVRAGAKVLQSHGLIDSYYWARDTDTITQAVLTKGPVVVGTNWHEGMFTPAERTAVIHVTGAVAGGHAYVINGVNRVIGLYRIKNSWGKSWGRNGHAYVRISEFAQLMASQGEALLATERPR